MDGKNLKIELFEMEDNNTYTYMKEKFSEFVKDKEIMDIKHNGVSVRGYHTHFICVLYKDKKMKGGKK